MWDGKSHDEIRYMRISIKNDKECLAFAPLGPIQKKRLQESINVQKERLKKLNEEKRAQKERAAET